MSAIHQCKDGGTDITGRGTPNKIPCENQGGEVGSSDIFNYPPDIQQFPGGGSPPMALGDVSKVATAGFMGLPTIAWIAIGGVALYYAYSKGMFKKLLSDYRIYSTVYQIKVSNKTKNLYHN